MAALEGEVRDLKQEVGGHQKEACQLSNKVMDTEYLKDQKEKEHQQQVRKNSHLCCLVHHHLSSEISGDIYRSVES